MTNAVTYEVYALINDRWLLDSSFRSDQRQRAISEAQQLAKRPDVAVSKVIRETLDAALQRMKETTVFRSDRDSAATNTTISDTAAKQHAREAPTIRRLQRAAARQPRLDRNAPGRPHTPSPMRNQGGIPAPGSPFAVLVFKVVLIGLASFAFASLTTWMVAAA